MLDALKAAFLGPSQARAQHREQLRRFRGLAGGVEALAALAPPPAEDTVSPIFLLSAGWRSGSTLLQRLIMSDKRVILWGEPYDECAPIQALAATCEAFRSDWPPKDYYYDGTPPQQLTGSWIANLFPAPESLRQAHRVFLDTLFGAPALAAGATRWGLKEVRLTIEHARYLKWLYPHARFVLLCRHPLDAYRSYCAYGRSWYNVYPHRPVFTPTAFGDHWRRLTEGFLADGDALGALLVRYEALLEDPALLTALDRHLDLETDHTLLTRKIGGSGGERRGAEVNGLERWLLRRATGPVAARLGYHW